MAHIVIDARIIGTSTGRYAERLLTYLERIDSENSYSVLLTEKGKDFWRPYKKNFKVVSANYRPSSLKEQLVLPFVLSRLKADLVHFTFQTRPLFFKGKCVITIHDLSMLRLSEGNTSTLVLRVKQFVFSLLLKRFIQEAQHVITPTNYVQEDIRKWYKKEITSISTTIEASDPIVEESVRYPSLENKRYLMYVGQSAVYKNLLRLAEAHHELQKKDNNLRLVLVGKRDKKSLELEDICNDRGYTNIVFTGFVGDGQLRWLYENAQLYVFASYMEGFGLPGLEAMQHGCPVVSSNQSCLPEVYGDSVKYFNPFNIQEMVSVIESVLQNQETRKRLIYLGNKQIKKFSWQRMANQTYDIYKRSLILR